MLASLICLRTPLALLITCSMPSMRADSQTPKDAVALSVMHRVLALE